MQTKIIKISELVAYIGMDNLKIKISCTNDTLSPCYVEIKKTTGVKELKLNGVTHVEVFKAGFAGLNSTTFIVTCHKQ